VDYTRDCVLFSPAGRVPRFASGLELRFCRRMLIDWVLRQRLLEVDNIRWLERTRVKALLSDPGQRSVIGVTVEPISGSSIVAPDEPTSIHADLVVDATGRGSRIIEWLAALGYAAPPIDEVDPSLGYASRLFRPDPERIRDWKAVEISASAPGNPRAAGLWEVEGGLWLLTLIGTAGQYPPTDEPGFVEFASKLLDPIVVDAIASAEPLGPIAGHRGSKNSWRHFEQLNRFPDGLVVLGDAVCAFNPLYGQGMTVAALAAIELDAVFEGARARSGAPVAGLSFQRRFASKVKPVWMLATSEDYRWPSTTGPRPSFTVRQAHRYLDLLVPLSVKSPEIVEAFLSVANMVRSPACLFYPRILWQLAAHHARSLAAALFRRKPNVIDHVA
jgi:2-polyprenyl-6-methoxyphenol hydroxylase-like FAD-dependent oxidoreductase